jgi:hypothetical protein
LFPWCFPIKIRCTFLIFPCVLHVQPACLVLLQSIVVM